MKEQNIDQEIGRLVRIHGEKDSAGTHIFRTEGLGLQIDGRTFADELEDCEVERPCRIDYIAVSVDALTPWFHMYSNYSTHFPLASNDKYNFSSLPKGIKEPILRYLKSLKVELTDEQSLELRRADWMTVAKEKMDKMFLAGASKSYSEDRKTTYFRCDFKHIADCTYSCGNNKRIADEQEDLAEAGLEPLPYNNMKEFKQYILDVCDNKEVAFYMMVLYKDYDGIAKICYLAGQSTDRYLRWRDLVPYVWDNVEKHMTSEAFNELLMQDPNDVSKIFG